MSSGYFLDELTSYELRAIIDGIDYCERNDLEKVRMLLSPNVKGDVKQKIKYPWDTETVKFEGRQESLEKMKKFLENRVK